MVQATIPISDMALFLGNVGKYLASGKYFPKISTQMVNKEENGSITVNFYFFKNKDPFFEGE